ncbi:MAG TPA: hypothetical protein VF331_19590 [Polyangiales bacterium]
MGKTTQHWMTLAVGLALGGCAGGAASAPGASTAQSTAQKADDNDSDGVPNAVVRKEGTGSVSALIGPPGGTLELIGGPRVEIPPGAVSGGLEFVLKTAAKTSAFRNKESEKSVGPIFIFSPAVDAPEGRTISVSIPLGAYPEGWGEVALAYEEAQGEVVGGEDSTHTKWQYESGKLSGGRAVAQLNALHGLRMQFVLTNLNAQ